MSQLPIFKIMVIGPSNVGKSSLLFFNKHHFFTLDEHSLDIVSPQCYTEKILYQTLSVYVHEYDHRQLFREEWKHYITSHLIIIMFDVTSHESFFKAKHLFMKFEKYNYGKKHYILLGNKCDLHSQIKIQREHVKQHFNESIYYFEISVKIDFCLYRIHKKIKQKMETFIRNQIKKKKKKRFCLFSLCS